MKTEIDGARKIILYSVTWPRLEPRTYMYLCPRSSDQLYIVTYYKNWVTTSWTHSTFIIARLKLGMLQIHWREKERGRESSKIKFNIEKKDKYNP